MKHITCAPSTQQHCSHPQQSQQLWQSTIDCHPTTKKCQPSRGPIGVPFPAAPISHDAQQLSSQPAVTTWAHNQLGCDVHVNISCWCYFLFFMDGFFFLELWRGLLQLQRGFLDIQGSCWNSKEALSKLVVNTGCEIINVCFLLFIYISPGENF